MGELHLDVYVERMKREYSARGRDRRAPGGLPRGDLPRADFDYLQRADRRLRPVRQGGRLHRALDEGDYEFVNEIYGGSIPDEYIPACDKGSARRSRRAA